MVAGIEQLRILNEDNLVEDSHRKGIKLLSQLKKLATKHEIIGDVRGKGLLVGVEINTEHSKNSTEKFHQENGALAKQIKALCFAKGLIVETGGRYGAVIRFLPALTIPEELLNKAVDILDEAIAEATQPKMSLMEPA